MLPPPSTPCVGTFNVAVVPEPRAVVLPTCLVEQQRPSLAHDERAIAVGSSRYLAADGSVESEYYNVFFLTFDDEGRANGAPFRSSRTMRVVGVAGMTAWTVRTSES